MFLHHRLGIHRNWGSRIFAISCRNFTIHPDCPMHDPQHDGLLLSGLRGHAGDIRAAAWQNNNLPVLPSDCCIWGSCGRLVYDLTDDRAAFTGEALYWDALQRSVPMDCTCNRNRKLSGEKSCACNHRDCAAWIIFLRCLVKLLDQIIVIDTGHIRICLQDSVDAAVLCKCKSKCCNINNGCQNER